MKKKKLKTVETVCANWKVEQQREVLEEPKRTWSEREPIRESAG